MQGGPRLTCFSSDPVRGGPRLPLVRGGPVRGGPRLPLVRGGPRLKYLKLKSVEVLATTKGLFDEGQSTAPLSAATLAFEKRARVHVMPLHDSGVQGLLSALFCNAEVLTPNTNASVRKRATASLKHI